MIIYVHFTIILAMPISSLRPRSSASCLASFEHIASSQLSGSCSYDLQGSFERPLVVFGGFVGDEILA